jgi:hypothetical protein
MEEREELTTADLAGRSPDGQSDGVDDDDQGPWPSRSDDEPLLEEQETGRFRDRWQEIQGGFVDRPREAVEEADRLVADLMQRLAAQFSETRTNLEQQWDRDDDVSTEDLRVALTRYRSFFERLLSA